MRTINSDARRAAILVAMLGALAATAWVLDGGASADAGPKFAGSDVEIGGDLPLLAGHATSAGPAALSAPRKPKPSIKMYITDEFSVAPYDFKAGSMKCPSGMKAIDGGFLTDGGIIPDTLAPLSTNTYGFSAFDISGLDGLVAFTITCSKGNG